MQLYSPSKQLTDEAGFKLPSKLRKKNYNLPTPCDDKAVNDIVQSMESELDQILQTSDRQKCKLKKQNLIPIEQQGLKYLDKMVSTGQIAITPADKGGSVLVDAQRKNFGKT